jgi:hypothetical protein
MGVGFVDSDPLFAGAAHVRPGRTVENVGCWVGSEGHFAVRTWAGGGLERCGGGWLALATVRSGGGRGVAACHDDGVIGGHGTAVDAGGVKDCGVLEIHASVVDMGVSCLGVNGDADDRGCVADTTGAMSGVHCG